MLTARFVVCYSNTLPSLLLPPSLLGHSATVLGHNMIIVGGETGEVDFTNLALIWRLNLDIWQWSSVTGSLL